MNRVKGKTIQKDGFMELPLEVQLRDNNSAFIRQFFTPEGMEDVVLVAYNGDYIQ